MEIGRSRRAGQSGRASVNQSEDSQGSIVDIDHPVGERHDSRTRFWITGQVVMVQQTACVVVLVTRPATVILTRLCVLRCVGAMRARSRIRIMIGVPEQTTVVGRSVVLRVVNVAVGNVSGEWIKQVEPGCVSRSGQLQNPTVNRIKLVVVVRDDRPRPFVKSGFVVSPEFSKMPPAVLINCVAFRCQRVLAGRRLAQQLF